MMSRLTQKGQHLHPIKCVSNLYRSDPVVGTQSDVQRKWAALVVKGSWEVVHEDKAR